MTKYHRSQTSWKQQPSRTTRLASPTRDRHPWTLRPTSGNGHHGTAASIAYRKMLVVGLVDPRRYNG
jgi:hypothetical protein